MPLIKHAIKKNVSRGNNLICPWRWSELYFFTLLLTTDYQTIHTRLSIIPNRFLTELNWTLTSSVGLCWLLLSRPKNPTPCRRGGGLQPEKGVMQRTYVERRLEDFVESTQSCLPWLSATRYWAMNEEQLYVFLLHCCPHSITGSCPIKYQCISLAGLFFFYDYWLFC